MDKNEKIQNVREAQDKIFEAIDLLNEAVGDDGYAKTYLIEQLQTLASSDHGFLCGSFNCDKLIEHLEEDEDE